MNQAHALLAGLLTGAFIGNVSGATLTAEPTAATPEFKIMTDQEVERHRDRMARLSGEARETYRNAEYEKLKSRAEERGYRLPDAPPWQAVNSDDEGEPATRIAAADETETAPVPDEAQRSTMKQRFERFLEERERRRAAMNPPTPPITRPADLGRAAAERREQAEKRHAAVRAEQEARFEQHQAEMEARRQDQEQRMHAQAELVRARAEQRQAELRRLRAEAGSAEIGTASGPAPAPGEKTGAGPEAEQVSEALARLREANADEREQLRQGTEQRIARQQAELEALREQEQGDASEKPAPDTAPGGEPAAVPDSETTLQARMDQRRAEAEAQRRALRSAPISTPAGPGEDTVAKSTGSEKPKSQARPANPVSGYYRHPVYPVYPTAPYPGYPYYPNPYWQTPR